ncbi:MAG TPA: ribonuclease P protein component [Candidatus Saccharimonadales bacterium]|nr:ribonuclease P protein component [Candidatus Saccharimonadales bacterium]
MIDRTHRFQGHGSLRFVYQKGQTVRGPFCALKYIVNNRRKQYRVAVVVSRKVHKSAVVRNRIRRRIYEIVRTNADNISRPYDLVITAYSDQLAIMPAEQLNQAIAEKLEKAGVLVPSGQRALEGRGIVEPKEN